MRRKVCPVCRAVVDILLWSCPQCGHGFSTVFPGTNPGPPPAAPQAMPVPTYQPPVLTPSSNRAAWPRVATVVAVVVILAMGGVFVAKRLASRDVGAAASEIRVTPDERAALNETIIYIRSQYGDEGLSEADGMKVAPASQAGLYLVTGKLKKGPQPARPFHALVQVRSDEDSVEVVEFAAQ